MALIFFTNTNEWKLAPILKKYKNKFIGLKSDIIYFSSIEECHQKIKKKEGVYFKCKKIS